METIKKEGYNLHIIKNEDFKTITMKIIFWNKLKEEDLTMRNLLFDVLLFSSLKYPDNEKMTIAKEDLYNMQLSFDTYRRGSMIISELNASVIEDKYSEKDNVLKGLNLVFDTLTNPNIIKNGFDKKSFEICKQSLKSDLKNEQTNPNFNAFSEFEKMLNNNTYTGSIYGNLKDLNKTTRKSLYKYYQSFFKNNHIDIYVLGNVNSKEILSKIDKLFKLEKNSIKYESAQTSYSKKYSEKVKSFSYNQSKLVMGASLNKLTKHEKKYPLALYSIILGRGPSSKLFMEVREKKSYCYSISSSVGRLDDLFVIRAGISYKNYENTKKEVLNQIEKMKKGEFTLKSIKEAKMLLLSILEEMKDSPWSIIDNVINQTYFGVDDIKDTALFIRKVTKEDIVKVAKKINIDTVFLLKGDINEED